MGDAKAPPPVKKKGPGVLLVLTALVMLAGSVWVIYAFVPLLPCPPCEGTGILKSASNDTKTGKIGMLGGECPACGGKGRLTLHQKFNIKALDPSRIPLPDLKK